MHSTRRLTAVALTVALGLAAAACGDDDDAAEDTPASGAVDTADAGSETTDAGGADTTEAGGSDTTEAAGSDTTEAGGSDTTEAGGSDTTEADAGGDAGGSVDGFGTATAPGDGPYGQSPDDENLYLGAAGFELDLADCPDDYDPLQGITDTEIKLAISLPKSGAFAGFGLLADGMISYFDYVNETYGGVDGRQITLDVKDDNYEPSRTKSNVDEMVQSGDYAAFMGVLGTANNLGIWDDLNEECMPHLLNATGAAQWGDVENHPWSTGMQIDYFTEASLWAEWIKGEFPDGATVAALTYNNDFGQSYAAGFEAAIEGSNIELVAEELHEAAAPNLTNQFTSLASSNADVLLIQTSGAFCTQAMAEIERGSWKPAVMMSGTCQSLSQFFQPLIDQGLTGADTYLVAYLKDVNEAANAEDPFVQLFKETVEAQGLDPAQTTYATGWVFAWYMTEFLNLASTFEGGLNRPNILIANRTFDGQMPLVVDGLTNHMEGAEDAYINEGGVIVQYQVEDPATFGAFVPISEPISREGELGTYATLSGG